MALTVWKLYAVVFSPLYIRLLRLPVRGSQPMGGKDKP